MNLFSDAQKTTYQSAIDDIHDSFSRSVVVWKDPERVIIAEDSGFNYFYRNDSQPSVEEEFTPVSGVFNMRILWLEPKAVAGSVDLRPNIVGNTCRLKMSFEAFAFISGFQRIDVDGIACEYQDVAKPHGLFAPKYVTVFAREIK